MRSIGSTARPYPAILALSGMVLLAACDDNAPAAQAPASPPPGPDIVAPVPAGQADAAAPAGQADAAAPRIIVIDRNAILRNSAAGKSMFDQAQNLTKQAENQFKGEENALRNEARNLQQQLAILAEDARAAKEREFNAKQQSLQTRVQQRQNEIQAGFAKAGQELDKALGPILQQIMRERGANLLVDRSAIILSGLDIDVTAQAIERLDQALPTVKVELVRATAQAAPAPAAPGAPAAPAAN